MPSFQAVSHNRRRQSISSAGSTYAYPAAPPRKPRPIIVASAIEKSDFRTHLDGMSASLRGKLGRLIKGGDDPPTRRQRPPGTASNSSDAGSRSTGAFTPSVTAVPSLSPSTPPSDLPAAYPALVPPTTSSGPRSKPQESVIHKIRRFEGGGKLPQLGWKSLSNNPELWDETGDTFVYMYMRGSRTKPPPSFRINSKVIEQSGSRAFIYQLHHVTEPDGWPRFYPSEVPSSDDGNSVDDTIASYDSPQEPILGPTDYSDIGEVDSIRPLNLSTIKRRKVRAPRGIQHELYIPWPGTETGTHSTIWHITTRNFFAVMYDANALVGTTLYEAMLRLFERVNTYPDYLDRNISRVAWITDYATRHGFDDVRNNPSYAASLLAFSENSGVQWREGYIEAFPHCVGMLNMGLQTVPEWRQITPHTKMYLQNASMEIEERVHRAQGWLFSFDFSEMWPTTSAPPSTARGCFDRLRKWLCKYYENAFLHWPPTNDPTWLTRDMVVRLKNDFEGLYDYLVDRDIIFDGTEYRPGQKWVITSMSGQAFRADTSELAFTDILLGFDERNNFPHIPHPYPITPTSMPIHTKPKSAFTLKKPASQAEIIAQSRRKALSYAEASNVYTLRDQYMHTDLVTNFIRFEQADLLDSIDPFEARRGRWLLIYGVLQVLATVSVDSPNLRYKDGVQYHLSPQMKGVVPWAEPGSAREEEAEHKRSHCWVVPSTWIPSVPKARPGAHKPILWGQFGDGRSRAVSVDKPLTRAQEASIGVKRAEEWVANNAGQPDAGSDSVGGGTSEAQMSVGKKTGRSNSGVSGAEAGSSGEGSTESAQMAARRRRALIHGFTDFQVPDEW
ncbi:hypothetical protein LPUS_05712 [Lasallia pustulata]|uniref:DUF8004 domain-containing protein n=1 Tax=Lasallia pustulata TaxID=136370 RepID=A0A1W5CZP9_9LECA|nr:hypothetical protein LPUS_05712 [Lasallia pustulata]